MLISFLRSVVLVQACLRCTGTPNQEDGATFAGILKLQEHDTVWLLISFLCPKNSVQLVIHSLSLAIYDNSGTLLLFKNCSTARYLQTSESLCSAAGLCIWSPFLATMYYLHDFHALVIFQISDQLKGAIWSELEVQMESLWISLTSLQSMPQVQRQGFRSFGWSLRRLTSSNFG